ncbi:MAG: hypothetical protein JNK72_08935 [Myxococcales bacterium]|nr:hypothetical protein [Myxococcales bacterium]
MVSTDYAQIGLLLWVFFALRGGLATARVLWLLVAGRVNFAALDAVVGRLMSAGNRERALRLARAAPKALVCQLLEVALGERVSLAPTGEGANYREGQGDRDAAARAHLEAKAKTLSAPLESQLHQAVGLNSVALVGGVWAYRLAAAEGYGVQLLAVEGALVVVSAVGFYLVSTLRRDLARGAASWARYVEPG